MGSAQQRHQRQHGLQLMSEDLTNMNCKRTITLLAAVALLASGSAVAFSIPWWTIDSGGTRFASGGNWKLAGTIGQHDATETQAMSNGNWTLTGGFWAGHRSALGEPAIFRDRFEQ